MRLRSPEPAASRDAWLAYARALAAFTIAYNLMEGLVSMGYGMADEALALFGFGADSFIEVGSALMVLWRLQGEEQGCATRRLKRERRAVLGIGILFLMLALGTLVGAGFQLKLHRHPETSLPGLIISLVSLSFMYWLWKAKLRASRHLDSRTLEGDAACSRACIQLSGVLFAGSLLFLVAPSLWWADSAAALVLAGFIAREGWTSIRAALRPDFTGGCGCH